jgi:hypoxanthine-DNA glycosylase
MPAQRQILSHGFGPFYTPESRILILGSFPSVKSREQSFFYGHPRNRFWPVLAAVLGDKTPATTEEKHEFLHRHQIALYDVIESCSIVGSADSSIQNVIPADLLPILEGSRVGTRIFTNGGKAAALYRRYLYPSLGIPAVSLPSTSPANAAASLQRLTEAGHEVLIVTATPFDSVPEKIGGYLFEHFPFLTPDQVIITGRKQLIRGDVLIDDGVHNLEGGDYVKILMTAPHNRNYDAEANGMIRVHDWAEAEQALRDIENTTQSSEM